MRSSHCGSGETNLTSFHEDAGWIPGLCSVGHRGGSDPELLWLWHRPAAAAPILPLAWELPYAMGMSLKKRKQKKKKKEALNERENHFILQAVISCWQVWGEWIMHVK